jgi:hypothetical protein
MSIFFTKIVNHASKIEAFEKRGLSGHVSSKVSEAGVFPLSRGPLETVLRYTNVNLELNARISTRALAYGTGIGYSGILSQCGGPSFEWPSLIVEMKTGGEVLNSFGMFETGTSKMGLYVGKPTVDNLRSIIALGLDMFTTVPAGNVNISGYLAFVAAWRGVNAISMMGGGYTGAEKMMVAVKEAAAEAIQATPEIPAEETRGKITRAAVPAKKAGGIIYAQDLSFYTGVKINIQGKAIEVSDPPTDTEGFVFPYFKEMLDTDPDTAFSIFQNYFSLCVSDREENIADSLITLRRGFRYLSSTAPGRVIQHVYFVMDMAIKMGCEIRLLRDGSEYAGAVILGKGIILYKKTVLKQLDADDFARQIRLMAKHHEAIQKIWETLFGIKRIDEKDEDMTLIDLQKNPRNIRKMVQDRRSEDIEEHRKVLCEQFANLRYAQEYWDITSKTIVSFFTKMSQKTDVTGEPFTSVGTQLQIGVQRLLNTYRSSGTKLRRFTMERIRRR